LAAQSATWSINLSICSRVASLERVYAAVVDRVTLDEDGIELLLANQLAKAVAKEVLAVGAVYVDRLRGALAVVGLGFGRPGKSPDLLDRADADAIGLAQRPVDRPGFG
jgi:hypothetical protein